MAEVGKRTIEEIYDAAITEKETVSSLSGLLPDPETASDFTSEVQSGSNVATWRWVFWVGAYIIKTIEDLWNGYKSDVEDTAQEIQYATAQWWQSKMFTFQYGDSLSWDSINYIFSYTTVDTAKQIIKYCAVVPIDGQVLIKVAKDTSGSPDPLSTSELTAAQNYIDEIKPPGLSVRALSQNADDLQIGYYIYYDPEILDATGTLISDGTTKPVEDTINDFIKNLPYNGVLTLSALTDVLQTTTGVVNCAVKKALVKTGTSDYLDFNTSGYQFQWNTYAGYMAIDSSYPLTSTDQIEYISV